MFYSDKIVAALQKGEMETLYGEPVKRRFYLLDDKEAPVPPSPHIPDYWLNPPHHPSALLHLCLDDPSQIQLKIADFSESYILDPSSSGRAAQPWHRTHATMARLEQSHVVDFRSNTNAVYFFPSFSTQSNHDPL